MERLPISLTSEQFRYLRDIKTKHEISMSAQIRGMIRDRMKNRSLHIEPRPRTKPERTKKTDAKFIPAINEELKAVFAKMREK